MMTDGTSPPTLSDHLGWDRLTSTSEALAEPGEQLYRVLNRDRMPQRPPALSAAELLAAARRQWQARRIRDRIFGAEFFPNPAWNILLDLFIAGEEGRNVAIKSACSAAGVPQSTALRYIGHLIEVGLVVRLQHPSDARSAFLKLTEPGRQQLVEYLSLTGPIRDAPGA